MSKSDKIIDISAALTSRDASLSRQYSRGGGSGGGGDMLEQRLERLEVKQDQVQRELASISQKLDSKPGHWAVLAMNATLIGLVLAAIGFGASIL